MQKVKAIIAHHSKGRLRFRIPERRHQQHYFSQCCDLVEQWSMVQEVEATPSTASMLIKYQGDSDALLAKSQELGFEIESSDKQQLVRSAPAWSIVTDMFEGFNKSLRRSSENKLDLPSFLFIGLLVHGLVQFVRRPAAVMGWETAWWFALNVYMMARQQNGDEPEQKS